MAMKQKTTKITPTTTPLRDQCLSHCTTLGIPLEPTALDELLSRAEKEGGIINPERLLLDRAEQQVHVRGINNMSDKMEDLFNKCNKLKEIQQVAKSNALLETELKNSIKAIQDLLNNRTKRLVLNENNFVCKTPATNEDIENFFEVFTFLYF